MADITRETERLELGKIAIDIGASIRNDAVFVSLDFYARAKEAPHLIGIQLNIVEAQQYVARVQAAINFLKSWGSYNATADFERKIRKLGDAPCKRDNNSRRTAAKTPKHSTDRRTKNPAKLTS